MLLLDVLARCSCLTWCLVRACRSGRSLLFGSKIMEIWWAWWQLSLGLRMVVESCCWIIGKWTWFIWIKLAYCRLWLNDCSPNNNVVESLPDSNLLLCTSRLWSFRIEVNRIWWVDLEIIHWWLWWSKCLQLKVASSWLTSSSVRT